MQRKLQNANVTLSTSPTRRQFLAASAAAVGAATIGGPTILRGAADSTAANSRLNLAMVGCGGQGRGDMGALLGAGVNLVAFCDPDATMIEKARKEADRPGKNSRDAKAYDDYRKLLEQAGSFDAVLIATPDHWHAPLCRAFIGAGKHVYCEKPLTHSVGEARGLRELARGSKVVTQMGNQGSASESLRRCTEIIQAGALGAIREAYVWGIGVSASEGSAEGEDPIPADFNWDLWVGPSAMRPFKKDVYHPFRWRNWFDFGNGGLADFCCHALNLPVRALQLSYPEKLVVNLKDGKQTPDKAALEFHFAARGELPALTIHWQGDGKPAADVLEPLGTKVEGRRHSGVMIVGEKGRIYTSLWNTDGLVQLHGEQYMTDVTQHPKTAAIPKTLPRSKGHHQEWVDACRGEGKTFSDFDTGGQLTEIGLSGVVALRAGKTLDWNGESMEATNAPEAGKFVRPQYRGKWMS